MFLLANREEDRGLKQSQLISHALIKMADTGLYSKAIERWSARNLRDRKQWSAFRQFMVEQYERLLREQGGSTMGQEGYGSAFNARQEDDDSLVTAVTNFAEKTTENESKLGSMAAELSELRAAMAALMMNGQPPPVPCARPPVPQMIQAPETAYFGQGPPAQPQMPPSTAFVQQMHARRSARPLTTYQGWSTGPLWAAAPTSPCPRLPSPSRTRSKAPAAADLSPNNKATAAIRGSAGTTCIIAARVATTSTTKVAIAPIPSEGTTR